MNKRINLWILFSLILVFFFVGCSDFYQDMGGSSIEMSFKVPEKIDERSLDSRSDTETDISTYKLVVKLESKNEELDKIEKNVCSGELVNLAFTNVKKGKTVKVSAQLFQDGKSVYFGESDWINTTKGKNYAKVVLEKDYRPLVPEITLQPSDAIHFMVNENENDVLSIPFIVTAEIEYEQNLSVQLQEKTENGWINYEYTFDDKSKIPYENSLMIMPTININIGESKVLRAAFTNSVTTETGKINSVTVYSNEVTLAYVNIDDYSLKHDRGYVIYGEEINIDDFELFANYTLNGNKKSAPVTITDVTCNNLEVIGDVPFTFDLRFIENGNKHCTASFNVPVKYQLNAEKLAITAFVTNDENTETTDSGSGLNIAQYTQNVKLSANYDDTVYLYKNETEDPTEINILENCNINWASSTSGTSIGSTITIQDESNPLLPGPVTYECTITPNANSDFIVGESVTKEYFVNVCPWEIELKYYGVATSDGVDNKTLEAGKTYSPKLTNEAIEDEAILSDVTYSVTGKDYTINDLNVITAPRATTNEQKATIEASWNGKEIASLDVVVPASVARGSLNNPIDDWTELVNEMKNEGDAVYISGNLQADETLYIQNPRDIIAASPVKITRSQTYTGELFSLNANLSIKGFENALIEIDGNNVQVESPMIYSTSHDISLEYVNISNCINTKTDGGAIYMDADGVEFSLTLLNCEFKNNKVTGSLSSGGAIALSGSNLLSNMDNCNFENNSASTNSGGAIYIDGTTVAETDKIHKMINTKFSSNTGTDMGGAIYLYKGHLYLDNVDFSNNTYTKGEETIASDIYVYGGPYSYVYLNNEININHFFVRFTSSDSPVIKLEENFSNNNNITFYCYAGSGADVNSGDKLITLDEGETLSNTQINCFNVYDTDNNNYTINTDGTISSSL